MTCAYSIVTLAGVPRRYLVTVHIEHEGVSVACYQGDFRRESGCLEYALRMGEAHRVPVAECQRSYSAGLPRFKVSAE